MLEPGLEVPSVPEPRAGGGWGRRASLALCVGVSLRQSSICAMLVPSLGRVSAPAPCLDTLGVPPAGLDPASDALLSPFRMTYGEDSNHQLGRSSRLRRQNGTWTREAGSRAQVPILHPQGGPPLQRVAAVCRPRPLGSLCYICAPTLVLHFSSKAATPASPWSLP